MVYEYKATIIDIYDADTMTLEIDLGFNIKITEKVRLYGIDTPELRTKNKQEKKLGYEARDYLRNLLLDKDVTIQTIKDKKGKFGRYLVVVYYEDDNINNHLIDLGYAKEYFGGTKEKWS